MLNNEKNNEYGGVDVGIGYVIGCLLSILLWSIERDTLFKFVDKMFNRISKSYIMREIIYSVLLIFAFFCLLLIRKGELYNGITAFIVIDISSTEKGNLKRKEKVHFYNSLSIISKAIVCGFVAPFFYISLLGNAFGIVYVLIYHIVQCNENFKILDKLFTILNIIPALITEIFMYFIYACRNKKMQIDFNGDFLVNSFIRPLLNVDILGAYIESVNFYYYYSLKNTEYLKSYGEFSNKVDDNCIKDYLSISYGICIIIFSLFYIIIRLHP